MVEPRPEADRRRGNRRLAVGFVLLVGLSAGLSAFYGGGTPAEIGLVGALGLATGGGLLALFRSWSWR